MQKVDFTFITIVYNDNLGCLNTINSISDSICGYSDYYFEHIIVDGSSDADLKRDIDLLKKPYIKLISEPDNGIYDAMNKGVLLSSGFFINFLNAGDFLVGNIDWKSLFIHLDEIKNNVNVAGIALASKIKFNNQYVNLLPRSFHRRYPRMPTIHQSMIYKKDVLCEIGYSSDFSLCGDFDNYMRIIAAGKYFVPINIFFSIFISGGMSTIKPFLLFVQSSQITSLYNNSNLFFLLFIRVRLLTSIIFFQLFYHYNRLSLFLSNSFRFFSK